MRLSESTNSRHTLLSILNIVRHCIIVETDDAYFTYLRLSLCAQCTYISWYRLLQAQWCCTMVALQNAFHGLLQGIKFQIAIQSFTIKYHSIKYLEIQRSCPVHGVLFLIFFSFRKCGCAVHHHAPLEVTRGGSRVCKSSRLLVAPENLSHAS